MIPPRVFVLDGQPAFADALAALFSRAEDLQVVGAASDLAVAVPAIRQLRPDVVTVDVDGGQSDVVSQVHEAHPRAAIVVVTTADSPRQALQAIWAGAIAWASKNNCAQDLLDVVRIAASGNSSFPPQLLGGVLRELVGRGGPLPARTGALATLTPREHDVLLCLVEGLDRKASAQRLHLSVNTVRTHVQSLFAKLDVHNTLEAVAVALDAGIRPPSSSNGTEYGRSRSVVASY
jgi:two-component system NarL family response regulator